MGACINKVLPPDTHVVRPGGPKRFDIFISHHNGGTGGVAGPDLSDQFSAWISEVCIKMDLKVFIDDTNLSRILDERKLRQDINSSRVVVGIVSRGALADPHGMQQELWWAHLAKVPIIPFYDGDSYTAEDYASWRNDFAFALQRPPVVYQRRAHLQAKDKVIAAIHDALLESYHGKLPETLGEKLSNHAARQQRRERRAERRRASHSRVQEVQAGMGIYDDENREKKWALPPMPDLPEVHAGYEEDTDEVQLSFRDGSEKRPSRNQMLRKVDMAESAPGSKQFRFRDEALLGEAVDDSTKGVQKLLKTLRDPLGMQEQAMRLAVLQERGDAREEERRYEPQHHVLKPARGILKGKSMSAGKPSFALPATTAASKVTMDPKLQKGVARLLEYLRGVTKNDMEQLPTVLKVLQLAVPNEEVAVRALAIVFEFVQDVATCRQVVAQAGGIRDIVQAMVTHSHSLDTQTYGCGCLYSLSCFRSDNPEKDNNSAAIAQAGGIARVVEAMSAFPVCREVQQFGAGALRHLAVEIGINRREVSSGGEIQLTMRGINKRMIAKTGGIEMISKAMQKFPDEYELQENGCAAVCNLTSSNPEMRVRAARAGCIRSAINTMRSFPEEPELNQLACSALRSLALGNAENKVAIVAQGGVRQLCRAMARHRADSDVNVQAVAALTNLTVQLPENKRAICDAGGLELAVAALRSLPKDAELQQQGLGLLHNLACDKMLRTQVVAAGALDVAEAASKHSSKIVQGIAKRLQRQLGVKEYQVDGSKDDTGDLFAKTSTGGKGASGEGDDADVSGLFAARRPSSKAPVRNKTLTKPQKRMMEDLMASMQEDGSDWLEKGTTDTSESKHATADDTSSGASGTRRRSQAAQYGIEDLEGFSEPDSPTNRLDYIVKRNVAKQAGEANLRGVAIAESPSGVGDFSVRRSGPRNSRNRTQQDPDGSASEDSSLSVRRGGTGSKLKNDKIPDDAASEDSSFSVRRGRAKDKREHIAPAASDAGDSDFVVRRGGGSARRERTQSPTASELGDSDISVRRGNGSARRERPKNLEESAAENPDIGVRRGGGSSCREIPRDVPASPGGFLTLGTVQGAAALAEQNENRAPIAVSEALADRPDKQELLPPAADEGVDIPDSADALINEQVRESFTPVSAQMPVGDVHIPESPTGLALRAPTELDAVSAVSSEASDGGWIDLMDDNSTKRIQGRVRREQRHMDRADKRSADSEGAQLLREMLGEVEIEGVRAPPPKRLKRTRTQIKLARALRRCGEAPPEKFTKLNEIVLKEWEDKQHSKNQRKFEDTAAAAMNLLDGLDGLRRTAAQNMKRKKEAALRSAKDAAAGAERLAGRVKEEGLVGVARGSKLSRRYRYGLEDDEDSIYDIEDLGTLGDAEAALLDAIGAAEVKAFDEAEAADETRVAGGITTPKPPARPDSSEDGEADMAKLQAASHRLEQRRAQRRIVKLL